MTIRLHGNSNLRPLLMVACLVGVAACSAGDSGNGLPSGQGNNSSSGTGQGANGSGGNGAGSGSGSSNFIGDDNFIDDTDAPGDCGNGIINQGEACDDGNTVGDDGCSADCTTIAQGFFCPEGQECYYVEVCGDARVAPGLETCDDGNTISGDGCSEGCVTEADWICTNPGEACTNSVTCGDGLVGGSETCDDFDTDAGDGCSASCELEPGWECAVPGAPCKEICGDGLKVGREDCDDGNAVSADGCSNTCSSELGFECDMPGAACRPTVCGDGMIEGGEACDDQNNSLGDGCSPGCVAEPDCTGANGCRSLCGDGLILPGDVEECDDGNTKAGDGCSADCKIETGFECPVVETNSGSVLTLPIVYRDFRGVGQESVMTRANEGDTEWEVPSVYDADGHPDFENIDFSLESNELNGGAVLHATGIAATQLSPEGRPVYQATSATARAQTTNAENFAQWFMDVPGVNATILDYIDLGNNGGVYEYESDSFFPLDGLAGSLVEDGLEEPRPRDWDGKGCWDVFELEQDCAARGETCEWDTGDALESWHPCAAADNFDTCVAYHNYSFTSELRYWFEFKGGEQLEFRGDDDVFVFINRRLVVDLGGLHEPLGGDVCGQVWGEVQRDADGEAILDDDGAPIPDEPAAACAGLQADTPDVDGTPLNLEVGTVYELALFQAERHTCQSNYRLTISGFTQRRSECAAKCGDGFLAAIEACDEGAENGSGYGHCTAECLPGPRCGDGIVQAEFEQCDNGTNGDGYFAAEGACAPGCVFPPYCGDGNVDSAFAEQCDNGEANSDVYNGCNTSCKLGPRCGDGYVQAEFEQCDDGNRRNGDGCSVACTNEKQIITK